MRPVVAIALILLVAACATPSERYNRWASDIDLRQLTVAGTRFDHTVYQTPASRTGQVLHIYVEGDGTPFSTGRVPSDDPTPRRALMVELLRVDDNPAVILGRPCFHGTMRSRSCGPEIWTAGRYSEDVVESMAAAARRILADGGYRGAVLIGHSGGGALAIRIAPAIPETVAVVTIAANLDAQLWADTVGKVELRSVAPSLPAQHHGNWIPELHLAGGRDEIVPAEQILNAAQARPGALIRVYREFTHSCCWDEIWPDILEWIDQAIAPSQLRVRQSSSRSPKVRR